MSKKMAIQAHEDMASNPVIFFKYASHDSCCVSHSAFKWKHKFWWNPLLFDSTQHKDILFYLSSELSCLVGYPCLSAGDAISALHQFVILSDASLDQQDFATDPCIDCSKDHRLFTLFRRSLLRWKDVTTGKRVDRSKDYDALKNSVMKIASSTFHKKKPRVSQQKSIPSLPKLQLTQNPVPPVSKPKTKKKARPLSPQKSIGEVEKMNQDVQLSHALSTEQNNIFSSPNSNATEENEETIFAVEKIIDFRFRAGRDEYLILWEGYSLSDATWEPTENINVDAVLAVQMKGAREAAKRKSRKFKKTENKESGAFESFS
ncbi:hypothetical protein IE077_000830 [Cardiosporidium cionae]|uniref:Chromo domain-containing protein n=1 Tax=Cardiosporidium cionae TaxID=476202 RepID=A0ABQ7J6G1_9APIC|nr:hypothetical protein IE077_000830 [Cardiosporidium cionae]|eukprot:KAF8819563.1 hypothetical protein IE077_000830 [Cardiosporidium cionae]